MKKLTFLMILTAMLAIPYNMSGNKSTSSQNIQNGVMIMTDKNFDATISKGIVMVDFYATWCGPCKVLSPIIEEIAQESSSDLKIGKMDTDKNAVTSVKYSIKYLPTVIIFKDGTPVYRVSGLQTKEALVNAIKSIQN